MRTPNRLALLALWASLFPAGMVFCQDTVQARAEGIRLDFQDVELRCVISALAEAGNLNVIYTDLPQRTVTLRMSRPVGPDEVLSLLRSLAASNGLDIVEDGELIRVLGAEPAPSEIRGAAQEEGDPGLRLYVHRLRYARATRLASTLQSLFGGTGQGAAPGARPDTRPLTQQLRDHRIPPGQIAASSPAAVESGPATEGLPGELLGRVQIVPEETTNSLLVRARPGDWGVVRHALGPGHRRERANRLQAGDPGPEQSAGPYPGGR